MARMKDLAIALSNLGYDPTTVTIAQLSKPRAGETPAERAIRLAAKAVAGGCESVWVERGEWTEPVGVTSATVPGLVYRLSGTGECPCEGYARFGYCCHTSLVAWELGVIGDTAPEPDPAPAAGFLHKRQAA